MPALTEGPLYDKLLASFKTWEVDKSPEFRAFRCALCGKGLLFAAWHVWLRVSYTILNETVNYPIEAHLCMSCGRANGLKFKV